MINFLNLLGFCFVIIVGGVLFHIKYEAIDLEKRLKEVHQKTLETKEEIQELRAEWAYLNRPERLQKLAKKYLRILPPDKEQVVNLKNLKVIQTQYSQPMSNQE